jgi:hypothetical protein
MLASIDLSRTEYKYGCLFAVGLDNFSSILLDKTALGAVPGMRTGGSHRKANHEPCRTSLNGLKAVALLEGGMFSPEAEGTVRFPL